MSFAFTTPSRTLPFAAVICDMDGLLIDSEGLSMLAWQETLARYTITVTEQDFRDMFGMRIIDDARMLVDRYHLSMSADALVAERMEVMATAVRTHLRAMPGAPELLATLHQLTVPLALATSGVLPYADLCLDVTALSAYFPVRVTGEQVARGKPAPDIFLEAASRLGIAPAQCVVLEDAPHGVTAAVAAGMQVIAVPNEMTATLAFPDGVVMASSLHTVRTWLTA